VLAMHERRQTIDARFGPHKDAAAVAPVAAIGSSAGNKLLAAKTDASVSAAPGFDVNGHAIDEHGWIANWPAAIANLRFQMAIGQFTIKKGCTTRRIPGSCL